jgi:hypothetical protein
MGIKLYEATEQLEVVNGWIEEHADEILANGGELPPDLAQLLDEAEGTLATKAERVALKVRELQAEAEAVKLEVTRLGQRAKTAHNAAESLKAYLLRALLMAGMPTVKGTLVTVALQKNPPAVHVTHEPAAGEANGTFVRVIPEQVVWDKDAIKATWKAGLALPEGVTVVQAMGLRIR